MTISNSRNSQLILVCLFFLYSLLLCFCSFPSFAQTATTISGQSTQDTTTVLRYDSLANASSKKPETAQQFVNEGMTLSTRLHYLKGIALLTYDQGIVLMESNKDSDALAQFNIALAKFNAIGLKSYMGRVYKDMALIYLYRADHRKAMELVLKALDIFEVNHMELDIPICYAIKGYIYTQQGDLDEGFKSYQKSYELAEALLSSKKYEGDVAKNKTVKSAYIEACRNMGNAYSRKGDYKHSLEYLKKGLDQSNAPEFLSARIKLLLSTSVTYIKLNDDPDAIKTLKDALSESIENRLYYNEATAYANLAPLMKNSRIALVYYDSAIQLARGKAGDMDLMLSILKEKYEYADEHGDYKVAIETSDEYHVLQDSIFSVEKAAAIKNLEAVNELDKASVATKVAQLKDLKDRNTIHIVVALIIVLVIIILAGIIYQLKLKKLQTRLLKQKKELVSLNATKDKIFSIISHDLRSPLAALEGIMPLLKSASFSPEELNEIFDSLSEQIKNSRDIMDKLLNWGSYEFKKEQVVSVFNAVAELQPTLQLMEQTASEKKITFDMQINEDIVIKANPFHFDFIIRNLLQNAVKYTPAGGAVSLQYYFGEGRHIFEIADTGIGMSEQTIKNLFVTAMESGRGTSGEKGIGIALMLAQKYAESAGDFLSVVSSGKNGTTFRYELNYLPL
jgi:signal transduction histidine kinase